MPTELLNEEDFIRLSETAFECRVKRVRDAVKLKLRTPKKIYTFKTDEGKAEAILKKVRCEVAEI
ncbi:hypothetical protein [[Eubacterium] cellulosolvens]